MAKFKTFYKGFLKGHSVLYVTSDFGKRWIDGAIKPHRGIDIGVPSGTTLLAPLSGKIVTKRVQKGGAGLYLTIEHEVYSGYFIYILMMHLHSVAGNIYVGKQVTEGDVLGTTGGLPSDPNAGHSYGAHLHLEVRKGSNSGSNAVDPKYWFLAKERLIARDGGRILNAGFPTVLSFEGALTKTQSSYKYSAKDDITVMAETEYSPKEEKKINTIATERLAMGIWQITKLLIDSSVENKQVTDSGISTLQGSLINFFRKVCQEPFVEFMGDTYGNQYYWITRRPPFDKESITRMIDLTMLSLSSDQIVSTDLSWNNSDIYSWYQYIPYADLIEVQEANLFIPAAFFPEFASVWGSKPLSVTSNYFSFIFSGAYNQNEEINKANSDRLIRNAVADFKFMVESNAYNAFTRRGTITILGDRRIKRGHYIQHTSGEIFYVDSVTNSFEKTASGVTRLTTLNVSRGMYPAFVYGYEVGGKTMSYFDIIDWGENFNIERITTDNWKQEISKWKVNVDNFGFFMSKQQVFYEQMMTKNRSVSASSKL